MRVRVPICVWSIAFMIGALGQSPANGQQRYEAPPPPPSMYGAYGGWGWEQPSTAAGSAMNGMANVISSKGDYNLSTSEAAINMTKAQSQELDNRMQYTNTYFQMKETNKADRAKLNGPPPTEQQLVHQAQQGVPRPLGSTQMDPVTGALIWPDVLQTAEFESQRKVVDQMFAQQASHGALSYADQTTVRKTVDAMFAELKKQIRDVPPPDYIASRTFLNSVLYAATKNELQ